ncbi:hypothetical protein Tco_1447567 [Tanacetum coccineum]
MKSRGGVECMRTCSCHGFRAFRFHSLWCYNIDKTCYGGEVCRLDEQNPRCLEDWKNIDFQDLVMDDECFQVEVHCCGGENSRKDGASLSSHDEDEDEINKGEVVFFPFSLLDSFEMCKDHNIARQTNGLRICLEDVTVKASQKHGKWNRAIFACVYFISLAKGAKEIFPKEKFHPSASGTNFVKVEFCYGVSLKLSGYKNGDVPFNKIMLRAKEIAIGVIRI